MECPVCHTPNPDFAKYCKNCGGALDAGRFVNHRSSCVGRFIRRVREVLWYIAGAKIDVLRLCPDSYGRYAVMGTLVCLTAMMAFLTGLYTAYTISGEWWAALLFAPIYSYIIFSIDRSFISGTPTEKWWAKIIKFFFRLVLAAMIGLIISTPVELMVFGGLIDENITKHHDADIKAKQNEIADKNTTIQGKINALDNVLKELDADIVNFQQEKERLSHKQISKRKDCDSLIKTATTKRDKWVDAHKTERQNYENEIQDNITEKNNYTNRQKSNDLITKYKALLEITNNDSQLENVSLLITFFFIFLEIVPVLIKLLNSNGSYEELFIKLEQEPDRLSNIVNSYTKIHKKVFGQDGLLDDSYENNFGHILCQLEEESHKAQIIYKTLDDMNHISKNIDY